MSDDARSDKVLQHAMSRSQQPRGGVPGPVSSKGNTLAPAPAAAPSPVNVFVVYDQGFNSVSSQIDDLRFRYVGVSPNITKYQGMTARRDQMDSVSSGFKW